MDGRVPLHWAARYNNGDNPDYERNERERLAIAEGSDLAKALTTTESTVLEMLLTTNPGAAIVRDKQGRFPLQLLLRSECRQRETATTTLRCVEKLLQIAPEALLQVDPQSRMLPFMTAASAYFEYQYDDIESGFRRNDAKGRLELIYRLLREDPAVLASGINTPKERQLKQQLEEAKITIGEQKITMEEQKIIIDRIQKENEILKKRNRELMEAINNSEDKKPAAKKSKVT